MACRPVLLPEVTVYLMMLVFLNESQKLSDCEALPLIAKLVSDHYGLGPLYSVLVERLHLCQIAA